ncbi:hypothetical protein [Geodermatophilus sabuli]|uniref:Uncharacterized protein n=1 Tax=Geodermatophilus sabuli TaxID=1564158 RepID=A0A285EA53_9ACTN|nr:hypothetical protein [Geodermatophilus sabuli]MBB3085731.1 hypothetical protein [Geodermatophilus sabuli]SNX95850.1 hypothetical protein SAMN06893097_10318 [Geodermatophilus sabuli]
MRNQGQVTEAVPAAPADHSGWVHDAGALPAALPHDVLAPFRVYADGGRDVAVVGVSPLFARAWRPLGYDRVPTVSLRARS